MEEILFSKAVSITVSITVTAGSDKAVSITVTAGSDKAGWRISNSAH